MTKFYDSEHGQYEDIGEALSTPVYGAGRFPPGVHFCTIAAIDYGNGVAITLAKETGVHMEYMAYFPTGLKQGYPVKVDIKMSGGVYLRRNMRNELALFDATTDTPVSEFTNNFKNLQLHLKTHKLAEPSIAAITCGDITYEIPVPPAKEDATQ